MAVVFQCDRCKELINDLNVTRVSIDAPFRHCNSMLFCPKCLEAFNSFMKGTGEENER